MTSNYDESMQENTDIAMVAAFFEALQLRIVRLKGAGADIEIKEAGNTVAFCEVKSLHGEFQRGLTNRFYNRLSKHIHKGVRQLKAKNSQHLVPSILAFVNHDSTCNQGDLFETLTGTLPVEFESGSRRMVTTRNVSNARIRDEKYEVDAYIWIDGKNGQLRGCFFGGAKQQHTQTICRLLALDNKMIETT
jgi:hypothetical protein